MTARPTILLAEPDEALAASLRFALELQGYQVEIVRADDLPGAWLDLVLPTCLILGERPRGTDMLVLADRLQMAGCPLPIVILTTNPSRTTAERAHKCGAVLIEKPLLGETLADTLRTLFETRNAA